ncbi:MAG: AAA family ATPase [Snowella sp.]|nr:AAA family ATPase [Snowella sp.]
MVFEEIPRLREDWNVWLRKDIVEGKVVVDILHDPKVDDFSWNDQYLFDNKIPLIEPFLRVESQWVKKNELGGNQDVWVQQTFPEDIDTSAAISSISKGLFSAGYGPFRRFTGGSKDYQDLFKFSPRLTAHLSIFEEKVALTECLEWLRELKFKQLEEKEKENLWLIAHLSTLEEKVTPTEYLEWLKELKFKQLEEKENGNLLQERNLLNLIFEFVNQSDFLPFNARIKDISSDGVTFIDGNDCELPVEELSDGYRSILSMTFDLIRQLVRVYGFDQIFDPNDPTKIIAPGVVLIDEIDVHLHPTWQRKIGIWFREHFPKIQFIVTTHSPLICQAASVGTVYRLPQPGSDEQGEMITGQMLDRLVYGNVLDAYGTEVFGEGITRSEISKEKLARLAQLNQKAKYETLTEEEQKERQQLKSIMSTNPDISQ